MRRPRKGHRSKREFEKAYEKLVVEPRRIIAAMEACLAKQVLKPGDVIEMPAERWAALQAMASQKLVSTRLLMAEADYADILQWAEEL